MGLIPEAVILRWVLVLLLASILAAVACETLRRFAIRRALLDMPNQRSLHSAPVPRLGGVAIVMAIATATALSFLSGGKPEFDLVVLLVAALLIAAMGLVDDLKPLRASVRFSIQVVLSLVAILLLGSPDRVLLVSGCSVALPGWAIAAVGTFWTVAVLNIYNFMDGMDGLAGSQALCAGIALSIVFGIRGQHDLSFMAAVLAAATGGFLVHNAPPARIFMGDAGSTFLGFIFALLGYVGCTRRGALPATVVPLAIAPFLLDGTFTIARRALRGERIWQAHRTHLYQRAAATGLSHRSVLVAYVAWMVVAAVASVLATDTGTLGTFGLASSMFAALFALWVWVERRERKTC